MCRMTLQIHGGYSYLSGFRVQWIYRDTEIIEIYEGTKGIKKMTVAGNLLK